MQIFIRNKFIIFSILLFTLLVFTIFYLTKTAKVEYINQKLGYSVLIPKIWNIKEDTKYCEGNLFYEYEPNPAIDAYQGFSVSLCVYKNTDIDKYQQTISVYGKKQNTSEKVDGILSIHYIGDTMIGVQHTILVENKENVYRITYGLPSPKDNSFYQKEKKKADNFMKSLEFID